MVISQSLIQGCGGSGPFWDSSLGTDEGGNIEDDPLFIDADGADDTAGTPDDNLRLGPGSPAIDTGENRWVDTIFDLDFGPRFFADADLDGVPDEDAAIDMGAYEAQYGWYVRFGDDRLEAGREYRTGFRASRTLSDTLAAYNLDPLLDADTAYALAATSPDFPPGIDPEEFFLRRLDTRWEIATGELLAGNDDMVKSMDMRFSAQFPTLDSQIDNQTNALAHFSTAVDAYTSLLQTGGYFDSFLAAQPDRISLLDLTAPEPNPYHDVQRLAEAAAKESLASLTHITTYSAWRKPPPRRAWPRCAWRRAISASIHRPWQTRRCARAPSGPGTDWRCSRGSLAIGPRPRRTPRMPRPARP
jgi:hypothetical protein